MGGDKDVEAEAVAFFKRVMLNARRLHDDAQVLIAAGSYPSAITLAILAIEEFGKALIMLWGVKNKGSKRTFPTHVEKQAAVFALLSANEILKKNARRMRNLRAKEDFNFHKVGPLSSQFAWARAGFYDDLRKHATFADEKPVFPVDLPEALDRELAQELQDYYKRAYLTTRNLRAMSLASEFYMNDLGRL